MCTILQSISEGVEKREGNAEAREVGTQPRDGDKREMTSGHSARSGEGEGASNGQDKTTLLCTQSRLKGWGEPSANMTHSPSSCPAGPAPL